MECNFRNMKSCGNITVLPERIKFYTANIFENILGTNKARNWKIISTVRKTDWKMNTKIFSILNVAKVWNEKYITKSNS